jgi:hypothetical protein
MIMNDNLDTNIMVGGTTNPRPASGEEPCEYCGKVFKVRGLGMHLKACRLDHEEDEPTPTIDAGDIDPENGAPPINSGCKWPGRL